MIYPQTSRALNRAGLDVVLFRVVTYVTRFLDGSKAITKALADSQ